MLERIGTSKTTDGTTGEPTWIEEFLFDGVEGSNTKDIGGRETISFGDSSD